MEEKHQGMLYVAALVAVALVGLGGLLFAPSGQTMHGSISGAQVVDYDYPTFLTGDEVTAQNNRERSLRASVNANVPAFSSYAPQIIQEATVTTLTTTPLDVEGLTADSQGNLYTVGRLSAAYCPVWKVNPSSPTPVEVGRISAPCQAAGLAFNAAGDLFIGSGGIDDKIFVLTPNAASPPTATIYASGTPRANGLAFDKFGNLWVTDGGTGQGRVWKITGPGANCATFVNCAEAFRIQPMRNSASLGGLLSGDGVGRQTRNFPPGNTTNTLGGQEIVANGIAFTKTGDVLVVDTARNAIWKAQLDQNGNLLSPTGCDTTFKPNTLCMSEMLVSHPLLEGLDGIALDSAGNIWGAVNARNAVVVATKDGRVVEVFRNPVNSAGRRNSADPSYGNNHILEFPTSPYLLGHKVCFANSDMGVRDNSPNTAGEANPTGAVRGKISCLDQEVNIPGLPLPV